MDGQLFVDKSNSLTDEGLWCCQTRRRLHKKEKESSGDTLIPRRCCVNNTHVFRVFW